jgi:hypothetical protein
MIEILKSLSNFDLFLFFNNAIMAAVTFGSFVKFVKIKARKGFWISSLYYLTILLLNCLFIMGVPIFQTY